MSEDLRSLHRDELAASLAEWQQPAYRVDQILSWLYRQRVSDWSAMANLPKDLREKLSSRFTLHHHSLIRKQGSQDTTQKFLWRLHDGALIESVLIPASPALYGERSDRHTICISTQVGCAYGCKFCASGLEGWKRNLLPHEIVNQIVGIERWHRAQPPTASSISEPNSTPNAAPDVSPSSQTTPRPTPPESRLIDNIVVMGMGEPLANYVHLIKALHILNAPWGGGIGARKITISTSGLVPQIRKLADEPHQFRLAISLHGATDSVREKIMPVNRKYPLAQLEDACSYYQQKKGRMITLEYILIAGINDGPDQIQPLARLARKLHAKINLIPYNKVDGLPWERPEVHVQESFLAALEAQDVAATLRREKGHDIDAACGQLRLKTERELNSLVPSTPTIS